MKHALILAGHGSHISPETGGLVWRYVDRLRLTGVVDEVTAALWKEPPSFAQAIETISAPQVTIVPLFTSRGFFTQRVIPGEMGLTGELTIRNGKEIRYAAPLHDHPLLAGIVRARIESALVTYGLPPGRTDVAIIGHSTRRHPQSRLATEAQVARLKSAGIPAWAVYLEDSPTIAEIYDLTTAPNLIAVPFFVAAGMHTTIDIPRQLGLQSGDSEGTVRGRRVVYTPPVGVDDDLQEVILGLASEAGAHLNPVEYSDGDDPWRGFPTAGRDDLIAAVQEAGVLNFGGLTLSLNEVRVASGELDLETLDHPAALRRRVRENPFRSLPTGRDLPGGWRVRIERPEWLHAIVETVYPGAVASWAAARKGVLTISSLSSTARRQVGMFRPLENLTDEVQRGIVARVCGGCIALPLWAGARVADGPACPEPCNHWMSAALESIE